MPDEVERLLDLVHQRNRCVEQERKTHGTEHTDVHVLDEFGDTRRNFLAFGTQRFEEGVQHRLDLVIDAKRLENRKTQRQQRYDRKQRRIDEAHGTQRQLPGGEITAKDEDGTGGAHSGAAPRWCGGFRRAPYLLFDAAQQIQRILS